jgi:hypothetical protein
VNWYEKIRRRLIEDAPPPAAARVYVMYHVTTGALTLEQGRELLDMPLSGIPCTSKGGSA